MKPLPMEHQKVLDIFIFGLKSFCFLAFFVLFLYLSLDALIRYQSWPTTSSVSYRFGDDGRGNYEFPAITICLDSFKWIGMSPNGMLNNCNRSVLPNQMVYYLRYCSYDMHKHEGEFYIKNLATSFIKCKNIFQREMKENSRK